MATLCPNICLLVLCWVPSILPINQQQDEIEPPPVGDSPFLSSSSSRSIEVETAAKTLGLYLHGIVNKELGVSALEEGLAEMTFVDRLSNDTVIVADIAGRMASKADRYLSALDRLASVAAVALQSYDPLAPFAVPCCTALGPSLQPAHQWRPSRAFGGLTVNRAASCQLMALATSSKEIEKGFYSSLNLTAVFGQNLASLPGLRWQYLMEAATMRQLQYPAWASPGRACASHQNMDRRSVLLGSLGRQHGRRLLVILLDRSHDVTASQLELGRLVAKAAINQLDGEGAEADKVALVALDSVATVLDPLSWEACLVGQMVPATQRVKIELGHLLDGLSGSNSVSAANWLGGLEAANRLLAANLGGRVQRSSAHILMITPGDKEDSVYQIIGAALHHSTEAASRSSASRLTVVALYAGATERSARVGRLLSGARPAEAVQFLPLHPESNLDQFTADLFSHDPLAVDQSGARMPHFHPPVRDPSGHSYIVPLVQSVMKASLNQTNQQGVLGAVGMDVQLEDIIEEILYQSPTDAKVHRLFVIDNSGRALAHPLLHVARKNLPNLVPISWLEAGVPGFRTALHHITSLPSGNYHTTAGNVTYTWQHVRSIPFIVVAARTGSRSFQQIQLPTSSSFRFANSRTSDDSGSFSPSSPSPPFQHHQLISTSGGRLCRHLRDAATMQTAALYLSPCVFLSPFEESQLKFDEANDEKLDSRAQAYMAYLTDPTRLIANPGLREGVRSEAALLGRATSVWREHAFASPLNNYIVRRRAATSGGTLLTYPGVASAAGDNDASSSDDLDPARAAWFRRAIDIGPASVVLSPPQLDTGGAGYIVTMSSAIKPPTRSLNGTAGDVLSLAAAVSADFTLGYLYKILNDTLPACSRSDARCFLLEDRGYVVAHPALSAALHTGRRGPLHLTHLEPFVATDLLAHKSSGGFIRKRVCRSVDGGGSLQRFFELNPGDGVIVNNVQRGVPCGTGPPFYYLTAVPGTNLFLGLIEPACNSSGVGLGGSTAAFCWCSTLDRTCLDCQHWEQTECECPCECESRRNEDRDCEAASGDFDDRDSAEGDDLVLPCQEEAGALFDFGLSVRGASAAAPSPRYLVNSRASHHPLPPCIHTDCAGRGSSEADCLGVLGCAWCTTDADGVTPLTQPFCASQTECFSGVVGSLSPYARVPRGNDGSEQSSSSLLSDKLDDRSRAANSPIGPVAGGIMAFFLLLALTAWAYRHWSSGDEDRRLVVGGGSDGRRRRLRGGRSALEEEEEEDHLATAPPTTAAGHHNYALHQAAGEAISVVSPYRMNPGYRRPKPAGTDSDHGYSTMTPYGDQDSEIMSCLSDPATASRRERFRTRGNNPLSLQSVTSGVSSRTASPQPGQHELPVLSGGEEEEGGHAADGGTVAEPGGPLRGKYGRSAEAAVPPGTTALRANQIVVAATVHMVES